MKSQADKTRIYNRLSSVLTRGQRTIVSWRCPIFYGTQKELRIVPLGRNTTSCSCQKKIEEGIHLCCYQHLIRLWICLYGNCASFHFDHFLKHFRESSHSICLKKSVANLWHHSEMTWSILYNLFIGSC